MRKKLAVIGAGIMGKGVGQRFAQEGLNVIITDINEEILSNAKVEIERNLKFQNMFQKKYDVEEVMSRISFTTNMDEINDVDFVVENVVENVSVKEEVYKKLETYCPEKAIFLANTSCIPITKIGGFTNCPERIIGVHFMNPVPMKNFAEVIKGWYTSQETIEAVKAMLAEANISCEVINDSPGFVSNRLSHLFMNEAAYLVYEGVATAQQIDNIFKNAFGHKMGPLETADLIGIDTVLDSLKVLYDEYEDSKFRACPLLKRMVEAKQTGRKAGKGFYNY